ncbi:MAG: hypothetical protein ACU0CO_07215 [Shimia sp.]
MRRNDAPRGRPSISARGLDPVAARAAFAGGRPGHGVGHGLGQGALALLVRWVARFGPAARV